jgi:hypothetical protein
MAYSFPRVARGVLNFGAELRIQFEKALARNQGKSRMPPSSMQDLCNRAIAQTLSFEKPLER